MEQITDKWLRGLIKQYPLIKLTGKCHDCGEEVVILCDETDDGNYILSGPVWKYDEIEKPFFKCLECFKKNPKLTNYRPTEVFSRVCGYMRPTSMWNKGKKAEWNMRKVYKVSDGDQGT